MRDNKKEDYRHHHVPELKEHALKLSMKEGASSAVSTSIGENYITPYALALGAQPVHIGYLSSFSGFLYQLSQLISIKMMEKYSRKRIVITFVFLQSILWLGIASLGIFLFKGFDGSLVYILIVAYSLLMLLGGIAYPAWFSWMGDLVPEDQRGSYFSKRSRIINIAGVAIVLLTSFLLDLFKTKGYLIIGFAILFSLASIFRFISFILLSKKYSPKFRQKKRDYFSIWAFIKRYDNFGKFAVYQGFFNLAIMVASPFFAVYMLKELGFSYATFIIVNISLTIFMTISLPIIGKISDKYGNKILLVLANILFIATPLLWLVSTSPLWIIFVPQLSAGIANAALLISYNNFTYDAVKPKHRAICISYANIFVGMGIFIGSLIGGYIVNYLHPISINPYIFVFLIAASLRLLVALFFIPQIKEVRKVKKLPSKYAMLHYPIHIIYVELARIPRIPLKILGKFKNLRMFQI
ncbi:MAG: MFS transporter [Candidatus Pacearchaeota archaeon]